MVDGAAKNLYRHLLGSDKPTLKGTEGDRVGTKGRSWNRRKGEVEVK